MGITPWVEKCFRKQQGNSNNKDRRSPDPQQSQSNDQVTISNSFLERLEATIRNLEERQSQTQEQIKEMVITQKREKELQPPAWFLRWNSKTLN